jgi:hypothetical protein
MPVSRGGGAVAGRYRYLTSQLSRTGPRPAGRRRFDRSQDHGGAAAPKTRHVTRWQLTRPDRLDPDDQARLAAVKASCPHLDALARHIRSFAEMMTRRQGLLALEDWLTRVEADDQPELRSFANGIRRDQQAVTAGLALPYSSAAMKETSTFKMIKRQMYGRASFRCSASAYSFTLGNLDHKKRVRATFRDFFSRRAGGRVSRGQADSNAAAVLCVRHLRRHNFTGHSTLLD